MKLLLICFLAVFIVFQTPALVLCDSNFNIISSGDDSVEYNEELGEQESSFRDNRELKEQESSFRDNQELKEQESIFRDNEELKEDSAVEFNEGLGDSQGYNKDL